MSSKPLTAQTTLCQACCVIEAVSVPSWNTFTIKARKLWNTDQGEFCHPLCWFNTSSMSSKPLTAQTTLCQACSVIEAVSVPSWNTFTIKARKLWNTDQGEFCHPLCWFNTSSMSSKPLTAQTTLCQACCVIKTVSVPSWNTFTIKARKLWNTDQGEFCHPLCWFNTSSMSSKPLTAQTTLCQACCVIEAVSVPSWNTFTIKARKLWNTDQGEFCHPLCWFNTSSMSSKPLTAQTTPSMLRHRSCVSPVLKHFYHQGPKALEHGPRWVLSSSLLIQHFQHVKQTTYSPNHSMPSMLRHRSCVSPVLKHFYHQGPKALEHGPRWVLSSSLLIQHFQHVKQTTYSPNHSMPSMLRHRSCVSPVLKHFYHQGPKALEHGPRWVLSSSLLIQHFQHVKQTYAH